MKYSEHRESQRPSGKNAIMVLNQSVLVICMILMVCLVSGCDSSSSDEYTVINSPAPADSEEMTEPDDPWAEEDIVPEVVNYVDEEPAPGETLTDARVRSLNRYATELIASRDPQIMQSFARRRVDGEELSRCYRVRVDGINGFNENNAFSKDLKSQDNLDKMIAQVGYAVEFAYKFHDDANGYPNRFFDTVTIIPRKPFADKLELKGRTLYLAVDYYFGKITPVGAFDIRNLWADGEHLGDFPDLAGTWEAIDPVSAKRLKLREEIRDSAEYVGIRLDDVINSDNERDARADLRDIARSYVLADYENEDGTNFRKGALETIDNVNMAGLKEIAGLWKGFITDSSNWEGMAEAVTAVHQAASNNWYDIDIEQTGGVLVGNFHNILVDVSLYLPRNRFFLNYVTVERVDQSIKVRQRGLVCVYTIDNVEVNVSVCADCGVETAGLEHAVNRI